MKESPFWDTIETDLLDFSKEGDTAVVTAVLLAINKAFREGKIAPEFRGSLKDRIASSPMTLAAEGSKESLRSICNEVMKALESKLASFA